MNFKKHVVTIAHTLALVAMAGTCAEVHAESRRLALGGELSVLHFPVAPCLTYYANDDLGLGACLAFGINNLSRSNEVYLVRSSVLSRWNQPTSSAASGLAGTRELRLGGKISYARGEMDSLFADDDHIEAVVGAARLELLLAPPQARIGLLAYVDAGVLWYASESNERLLPHVAMGVAVTLR